MFMRAKVHSILIGSVICAQLCATVALAAAHPTHTLSRESRRVVPAPAHQAAHKRASHKTAHTSHKTAHTSHKTAHTSKTAHTRRTAEHTTAAHHKAVASPHHSRAVAVDHRASGVSQHPARTVAVASESTAARVHAWEKTQRERKEPADEPDATVRQPALSGTAIPTSPELPRIPSIEQEASTPVLLQSLYDKRGHLVVPPPLYGSHEILVHQNMMADKDGLTRVRNDKELLALRRERKLVPLPASKTLRVDHRLPRKRRFSRPWTAEFLTILARDFYHRFHAPLQVNSAVRTVDVQEHLMRTNGNAAPAEGDTASPHLTGQAVDIGKRGLTRVEVAWMRDYLGPLMDQGKIDVEEEFQQSCFHISVYKSYRERPHLNLAATPAAEPTTD